MKHGGNYHMQDKGSSFFDEYDTPGWNSMHLHHLSLKWVATSCKCMAYCSTQASWVWLWRKSQLY